MKPMILEKVNNVTVVDPMMNGGPRYMACYLVECGDKLVLIDSGQPGHYADIKNSLAELGYAPTDIDYLFITHEHADHMGGAGYFLRDNPNIWIGASKGCCDFLMDPEIEKKEREHVYMNNEMRAQIGVQLEIEAKDLHIIEDRQVIDINGHHFTFYHTPGHRNGTMTIMYEEEKILFVSDSPGNCFVDCGSMYVLAGVDIDYPTLINELGFLQTLGAKYLAAGHFGMSDEPNQILEESRQMHQYLVTTVEKIMRENPGQEQNEKLEAFFWEQCKDALELVRNCRLPGRGEKIYQYATQQHLKAQVSRFVQYCQTKFFPELAPKA